MEADMVSYMENLTAATAEKERIGAELSLASTIQLNSIPNVFPAFPDRQEFDIYATMTPAFFKKICKCQIFFVTLRNFIDVI